MDPILLRALATLGLIALGVGGYRLLLRWQLARAAHKMRGLESLRPGALGILYFTTPTCQPCKTVQRPALRELGDLLGECLQVIQVDATQQPELADYWGVLSVPTTFLIDSSGQPRRVNHGVARTELLLRQLEEIEGGPLLPEGEAQEIRSNYSSVS